MVCDLVSIRGQKTELNLGCDPTCLSEECKVQTPAFTDAVRLYRQANGQYGTWDLMCGMPPQVNGQVILAHTGVQPPSRPKGMLISISVILANLVMETLLPELRTLIAPRLKGKMQDRQRNWMLISDAVYGLVQGQTQAQYEAIVQRCEAGRPPLETSIRTDMDQIITSKEHVTNKIRALVLPKAEELLKTNIQPYINSILDALMEPTSRGFSEVRDVFFRELVDMSKNALNDSSKEKLGEHMEKVSMLAFHPVKMQSCYEKVEQLQLEGLQQRFDMSNPSVFIQRAQILMREQMDNAVFTFEQLLHQSLEDQGGEELCKTIQRCQDRVIKKYDYDSSTVRKKFFREALLQILIPYMLKQLSPACAADLPHFQELIFEDFSRFILVENMFEEVVLQSVMKDIMMAVKEAAVQRRHNLYRDSIVLTNSDPNLHLLGENPAIDWAGEFGGEGKQLEEEGGYDQADGGETQKRRRVKQVVSMIQLEGTPIPYESCLEVPGVEGIPEEGEADTKAPKTDGTPKTLTNGAAVPEKMEDSTPAPSLVEETQSKQPIESTEQATESKPPTESVEKEVESKPTESVEKEVESKPTESVEKEVESKPTESVEKEVESKPTESVEKEVESKPTESVEKEVQSKPPTESVDKEVESKPPTESVDKEVESKPPTESVEKEVESKPPTESVEKEVESKPPTESVDKEVESKPPTESVEKEVESKSTESVEKEVESKSTESVEKEVESKPTESVEKKVESKPTESTDQEAVSKPFTEGVEQETKQLAESAEQEVESKVPTEGQEKAPESNQPTESAEKEGESKQPPQKSQQEVESASAIESAIQEIENAVQGEESEHVPENMEQEATKAAAPKQEEELSSTGTAENASDPPPEVTQPTADSAPHHDDSGFQSPTSEATEEEDQPVKDAVTDFKKGEVAAEAPQSNSQTVAEVSGKEEVSELDAASGV
ncbi:hypothetical protein JZ751_001184 [Albula glossodonta]|uniref:Niban 1/2/3 domain-containing protein n=1 Tax=Albula glossodonta TaxID=121402 RepID=A0A8T2PT02_9TELE|nr:hypothetical protein JZ751_001184 [Albula glossodonta]